MISVVLDGTLTRYAFRDWTLYSAAPHLDEPQLISMWIALERARRQREREYVELGVVDLGGEA